MDFLERAFRKVHSYVIPTRHNAYRPRFLRGQWLLFFLALVLTAEGVLLANVFAGESARNYLAAVLPVDVVTLTNLERGFTNVPPVTENALLTAAANAKARDMASKGYFSHNGPDGKEPWEWITEAGYAYGGAGENLAVRFNDSADVVQAWMASPTHRANIVRASYTEIGVGVAEGMYKGAPATFVVQYFARPAGVFSQAVTPTGAPVAEQTPQVLGAAAETAAKTHVAESVAALGAVPASQAFGVLTGVAVFLLAVVFLTFAINIQVQPVELLLGGAGVAAVAVAFVVMNASFVMPGALPPQTASVFEAARSGVELGPPGAFTPEEGIMLLPPPTEEGTLEI